MHHSLKLRMLYVYFVGPWQVTDRSYVDPDIALALERNRFVVGGEDGFITITDIGRYSLGHATTSTINAVT